MHKKFCNFLQQLERLRARKFFKKRKTFWKTPRNTSTKNAFICWEISCRIWQKVAWFFVELHVSTFGPIGTQKHFESMKCVMKRALIVSHLEGIKISQIILVTLKTSFNKQLSLIIYYANFSRQPKWATARHNEFSLIWPSKFQILNMLTVNKIVCGSRKH